MKNALLKTKYVVLSLGVVLLCSCSPEDGEMGPPGPQGPQGEQGIPGQDGADGADGPTRFSIYTESGSLNTSSVTATTTFAPIGPELVIDKEYDDSKIEVFFNSNCLGGTFNGATGIRFEIRIDGNAGNYGNNGTIGTTNSEDFISIFDVFDGLSSGNHSVQVYVRTNSGTSTGVILDPGGWGGRIIAKETF